MTNKQINKLLKIETKTLFKYSKLYDLLISLDYDSAKILLKMKNKETFIRVLENERYFKSQLEFEKELYPLLINGDKNIWKKLSKDKKLTKQARLRSAYLYVYLSKIPLKLNFSFKKYNNKISFFHDNTIEDGDGFARMFGLKNGLDDKRFNQYKNKRDLTLL